MSMITETQLENAAADALTLELVVNGANGFSTISRLGQTIHSLATYGSTISLAASNVWTGAYNYFDGNFAIGTHSPIVPFDIRVHAYINPTTINTANTDGLLVEHHTEVSGSSGNYDDFGISSQLTVQKIDTALSDIGLRCAITGDAYSSTTDFKGALTTQIGVRGRAGFRFGTPGAQVLNAYSFYGEIVNTQAGVQIGNAYVFYASNDDPTGTIVNRYDAYMSSTTARNFFAGFAGFGLDNPDSPVDVYTAAANVKAINVYNHGAGTLNEGVHVIVDGASATGYGIYSKCTGSGANYAFYGDGGDMFNAGKFGVNGATPQNKATVNAACTDLPTAVALINQLRALLIANGQAV